MKLFNFLAVADAERIYITDELGNNECEILCQYDDGSLSDGDIEHVKTGYFGYNGDAVANAEVTAFYAVDDKTMVFKLAYDLTPEEEEEEDNEEYEPDSYMSLGLNPNNWGA